MQYKKVVATIPGVSHPDGSPHQDSFFVLNDFRLEGWKTVYRNPPAISSEGEFFYLSGDVESPTAHRVYDTSGADFDALREVVKKERRRIEEKLRKDKAFLFSLLPVYVQE